MKENMSVRNRLTIYILLSLLGMAACSEEEPVGYGPESNGELRLSGVNARAVEADTRAGEAVKGYFPENTLYRIWMYDVEAETQAETQREGMQAVCGWDVEAGDEHYIQLPETAELSFKDEQTMAKFYGLTDPAVQKSPGDEDFKEFTDEHLKPDEGTDENPAYTVRRNEKGVLPDLRATASGPHKSDESYVIPLPFKHILSKVNFEIVQQVDETGSEMFGELSLVGISVLGQPVSGVFQIREGQFGSLSGKEDYQVEKPEGETASIPIGTTPKIAGSILLFPMPEAPDEEKMLRVRVTLGSEDRETLAPFAKNEQNDITGTEGAYRLALECPVYATPTEENPGKGPLRLEPNYEYDLQFVIMSNEMRIITIVPRVYEWLDGETSSQDEEGQRFEEQDLGQPVTFNGVMWSDRNLGASSAHPLNSVADWMKSVGYFYQYDRNIPYFPNTLKQDGKVDLNTKLDVALDEKKDSKRKLYPVVNYSSWKGVNGYPRTEQISPVNTRNSSYFYVNEIDVLADDPTKTNMWGFIVNKDNVGTWGKRGLWSEKSTQPCPKGWRLPTRDDFMGLLPGSVLAGNITFRVVEKQQTNGDGGWEMYHVVPKEDEKAPKKENELPVVFGSENTGLTDAGRGLKIGGNNKFSKPTLDQNGNPVAGRAYLGEFPCIFRGEQDDPSPGSDSHYVLSMKGGDWHRVIDTNDKYRPAGFVFNWGVVYGIKHVGTAKAYRMKWEINLVSDTPPQEVNINTGLLMNDLDMYEGENGKALAYKGIYGVITISRYTAKPTDRFDPDEDGSYEWVADRKDWWANPVEVMYLPICGVAGKWKSGQLYNIGAESWYAMEEENGEFRKNIFWIKIGGDSFNNQSLFFENQSPKHDVVSIRCVRDN